MNEADERKAYEKWMHKSKETIIDEWQVWQARAALSAQPEPAVEPNEWLTGCPECGFDKCDCYSWPEPAAPTVVEPVAWMSPASQPMAGKDDGTGAAFHIITTSKATGGHTIPLYTHPPRAALTDEELIGRAKARGIHDAYAAVCFGRAIEAAHGIGGKQ
jgi:hypothetical protein